MKRTLTFMSLLMTISALIFALLGCAALPQGAPTVELDSSRLSCPKIPQIVDGNLNTAGELTSLRSGAGAIVKLDKPTYVKYVEVYAKSKMSDVMVDIAMAEPARGSGITFSPVREQNRGRPIGKGKMRKYRIGKEILYLRLTTDSIVDGSGGRQVRVGVFSRTVPVKGPAVREIKFYAPGDAPAVESDQPRESDSAEALF